MANSSTSTINMSLEEGYISLTEFWSFVQQSPSSPYTSKFSFSQLIEEWQARSNGHAGMLAEPLAQIQQLEAQLEEAPNSWKSIWEEGHFEPVIKILFPSFFFKNQYGFIKAPFENFQFRYQTQAFREVLAEDRWEFKVDCKDFINPVARDILVAGTVVLNTFYKQNSHIYTAEVMTLRDKETLMERHFKFNLQLDYVTVKALKPLKKLSKKQIHELLNNLHDEALWLKYIPPENFVFEGFIIGFLSDVTREEILSTMKVMVANEGGKSNHLDDRDYLEVLTRSFLDDPKLQFGVLQIAAAPWLENLAWCLLRKHDNSLVLPSIQDPQSSYGKVLSKGTAQVVDDLRQIKNPSPLEEALLEKGLRSLLLSPLRDEEGKILSILEIASPEPYSFSQLTLLQLEGYISIMEMGNLEFFRDIENSVRLTIQQEFTSIHPSVEWKFREVASQYYWNRVIEEKQSRMEPIVFKEVFPLYGQADIVGSSKKRNASIQADLIDNLERLYQLLHACKEALPFHLLDAYALKVKARLEVLQAGNFASSDESVIVELMTQEVHPLLRKLADRFDQLPHQELIDYFTYLDPDLDIVYRQRKDYEESVSLLNQTISRYLLAEEDKMQKVLPHYFEKFQTDGVEYNLYLGQSLLENGGFDTFYLRDFRLWQLISMCEITRLVKREGQNFPVPLMTAQLVFVYNNTLSIRFRMDEKQFDIDGAYNVRYEILKKRIDKAYVKGTDERLTQAGKIAIVWLQEKDRQEYQEYLDYLIAKEYISPEVEDLELERMQGVEGLKAIRVEVIGEG